MENRSISADLVIDKILLTIEGVAAKRYAGDKEPILYILPKGEKFKVYSWVMKDNQLWWQSLTSDGRQFHVKHEPGRFDLNFLSAQIPAKAEEKKQPEATQETFYATGLALGLSGALFLKNPALKLISGAVGIGSGYKLIKSKLDNMDFDLNPFN